MRLINKKTTVLFFYLATFLASPFAVFANNSTNDKRIDKFTMGDEFNPAINNQIKAQDPNDLFWIIRMTKINNQYYSKLAFWYETAKGGLNKPDFEKAFEWYYKAATEANDAFAQYKLGEFYEKGVFVEADLERSFKWYDESAINSYPPALRKLGDLYRYGNDFVKKDLKLSRSYYESAANLFDSQSQLMTALSYQSPPFDIRNQIQSVEWYLKYLDNPDPNKQNIAESRTQLQARKECINKLDSTVTVLISHSFDCANEGSIKELVNYIKAEPLDEDENSIIFKTHDLHKFGSTFIYDVNRAQPRSGNANGIFNKSSSIMRFKFSEDNLLESVTYLFPAIAYNPSEDYFLDNEIKPDDRLKAVDIKNRFSLIFGDPQVSQETIDTVTYRWLFKDGIIFQIYRRLPSTHTFVSFHNPVLQQKRLTNENNLQGKMEQNAIRINIVNKDQRDKVLSRFSDLIELVNTPTR